MTLRIALLHSLAIHNEQVGSTGLRNVSGFDLSLFEAQFADNLTAPLSYRLAAVEHTLLSPVGATVPTGNQKSASRMLGKNILIPSAKVSTRTKILKTWMFAQTCKRALDISENKMP